MIIANKVHQTSQFLIILLHVRAQLDMFSLGHLSLSVVTPGHLSELLLRIQAELPHHLRLPTDLVKELWRYYSALGSAIILEGSKLLVLVSVPLLERGNMFEIYEVINPPIPYPRVEQKYGIME